MAAASAGLGWKTSEVGPSCRAPKRPARFLETGLGLLGGRGGTLQRNQKPGRTCLDVTRCKGWDAELLPTLPPEGAQASRRPRRRSRSECRGILGPRRPRARTHEAPVARGARPLDSPLSHKPLPARSPRPCAPSRGGVPTIKPTIETFPKRAICLLPINRSAEIKKSMWPGWASH